jgi:hypothetical protein
MYNAAFLVFERPRRDLSGGSTCWLWIEPLDILIMSISEHFPRSFQQTLMSWYFLHLAVSRMTLLLNERSQDRSGTLRRVPRRCSAALRYTACESLVPQHT